MTDQTQIQVPEGISIKVVGNEIEVSGKLGKNRRRFNTNLISAKVSESRLDISARENKKVAKIAAMAVPAFAKQISSDIEGVTKGYEIRMEIVYAHFPMTVEISGKEAVIKNMLGERSPRRSKLTGDTKIEVKGKDVIIHGSKLDDVAQTAANIRKACKVRNRDERIFQDGIYYTTG
jgi:Ribosomal protein L6P/L9E